MIFHYGFSLQGKHHIKKGKCCQDSHITANLGEGFYLAAVADGVGSAKNAQIGAKIAVESLYGFCKEYMPIDDDPESIAAMLKTAYNYALMQIYREALKNNEELESYDTTLSAAIYMPNAGIVYGHAGDGAIIGLDVSGKYFSITRPQKGYDGISVIPLRSFGRRSWEFGFYDGELVSVMLLTDGMLDIISPMILSYPDYKRTEIYVPLASFFADPTGIAENLEEQEKLKKDIVEFASGNTFNDKSIFYKRLNTVYGGHIFYLARAKEIIDSIRINNFPAHLMRMEQDDKSVACIINMFLGKSTFSNNNPPESYYEEPDWNKLQKLYDGKHKIGN